MDELVDCLFTFLLEKAENVVKKFGKKEKPQGNEENIEMKPFDEKEFQEYPNPDRLEEQKEAEEAQKEPE